MTKSRTYACPGNGRHPPHQFTYLHHPSVDADPLPRYCGICGFDNEGEDLEPAVTSPHIGLPIRNTVDALHRNMEAGAEFRAQQAQEQFGLDTDDANMLKLGDMKDGLREGDTSNIEVRNDITKVMEAAPPGMFGFRGEQGVGYSQPVSSGPFPNMGARTQKAVREAHVVNTADPRHIGTKSSSVPALETASPNYRIRVR